MPRGTLSLLLALPVLAAAQTAPVTWARAGERGGNEKAAVSPDGQMVALPNADTVRLVRASDSNLVRTIDGLSPRAIFTSGGGLVVLDRRNASETTRRRLRFFDATTFALVRTITLPTPLITLDGILSAEPGGNRIVVNGRLMEVTTGNVLTIPPTLYEGTLYAPSFAYGFGPAANTLNVQSESDAAFLINADIGTVRIPYRDGNGWLPAPYEVAPDLNTFLTFIPSFDGFRNYDGAQVRRATDGGVLWTSEFFQSGALWKRDGTAVAFSGQDGDISYGVFGRDGSYRWAGYPTEGYLGGQTEAGFVFSPYFADACTIFSWENENALAYLTFGQPGSPVLLSPDGKTVASNSRFLEGVGLQLRNAATGAPTQILQPGTELMTWAGNDRILAGVGTTVYSIRVSGTSPLWTRRENQYQLLKLSSSRDGRVLAAWNTPKGVLNEFIDRNTGARLSDDAYKTGMPGTLAFDGQRISFWRSGRVRVTDASFNLLREWTGISTPSDAPNSVALSVAPRGGKVGVAAADGIYLGDIATGDYRKLSTSRGWAVAFTREGGALFGSEGQGTGMRLKYWAANTGSLRKTWTDGYGTNTGLAPKHLVAAEVGANALVGSNDGAVTAIRLP